MKWIKKRNATPDEIESCSTNFHWNFEYKLGGNKSMLRNNMFK